MSSLIATAGFSELTPKEGRFLFWLLIGSLVVFAAGIAWLLFVVMKISQAAARRIESRTSEVKRTGQVPVTAKKENDHG